MSARRVGIAVLSLLVVIAITAWWMLGTGVSSYPRANVVLVTIDTLRADRLGSYGHDGAQTPHLDGLASGGIRFDQAIAPVPLTQPSHTSIMTAVNPPEHGVRDNGSTALDTGLPTLARSLQAAGYDTGAFVGAYVLHSRWGLADGFAEYGDTFDYDDSPLPERRGDAVVDEATAWLRRDRDEPFFCWIHLYDPHSPYAAPEPYRSRFGNRPYDGEVAYADAQVGRLLETLSELGVDDDTVVLVTSDHGEGLDDHGETGHGLFLYDTTQRVPLILRLPDGRGAGEVVGEQVRLIDVAPTLLELLEVDVPERFRGSSLVPFVDGGGSSRPAYAETVYPRTHFGWKDLYALRADGLKYVLAPREELYDLQEDPDESENVFAANRATAATMRDTLEELRGEASPVAAENLSEEARQRLRSLGYIGRAPAELPEVLPDPKDKVHLLRDLTRAQSRLQAGRPAEAVPLLERLVAEDPNVVDAHLTLGNARFAMRDLPAAARAFRAAVELSPDYTLALANLAMTHQRMGDLDTARREYETVLEMDPGAFKAHYNLGEIALEQQRPQEALQHFEAARDLEDSLPGVHFGAGVAELQLGRVAAADRSFRRTAEIQDDYPELNYYRALVAEQRGDPAAAVDFYRREVEAHPGNHRAWFNLSLLYADQGRRQEEVEALRGAVEAQDDFAVGFLYLGRSLLQTNDPALLDEAEQATRRGLSLDPPREFQALGHYVLADVYNRQGRTAAAQQELRKARAISGGGGDSGPRRPRPRELPRP